MRGVHDAKALDAWHELSALAATARRLVTRHLDTSFGHLLHGRADACAGAPAAQQPSARFDLTIYNHEDLALWMRSKELLHAVDQTILIQTASFSGGRRRRPRRS